VSMRISNCYLRMRMPAAAIALAHLMMGCASTPWTRRTPEPDSHYKYVVGRSYDSHDKEQGLALARKDGQKRAIQENFDSKSGFQEDVHEETDGSRVIDRSRTISRNVNLRGLEEVEIHQDEIDDGIYNSAVLYRYSFRAIDEERHRLATTADETKDIQFPEVDTTPNRKPAQTAPEHRVIESTFVLGLGASFSSATMKQVDNGSANFRLLGEMRLNRYVGLDTFLDLGGKTITYPNGGLSVSNTEFGVGLPVYFSSADRASWTPYLEPTIQATHSGFSFADTYADPASSASKWQVGMGANLGVQIRFYAGEGGGLSLRAQGGIFEPVINSEAVTPKLAGQGAVLLQWEFFK
jgi:hypothetical protein